MGTLSENALAGVSLSQHTADNPRASPLSSIHAHGDTSSHPTGEAPLGHLHPLMVHNESTFGDLSPQIPQASVLQGYRAIDEPSPNRAGSSSGLPNDHITVREAGSIGGNGSSQDSGRARRKRRRLNNGSVEVITISDDEPVAPIGEHVDLSRTNISSVRGRIENIRHMGQNSMSGRERASGLLQAVRDAPEGVDPFGSFIPEVAWGINPAHLVAQRTAGLESQNASIINATLPTIPGSHRRILSRSPRGTDSNSSIRPVYPEARRDGLSDRYVHFYQAFTDESSPVNDSFPLFSDVQRPIERSVTTSTHVTRPTRHARRRSFGYFRRVSLRRLANFQALHEQRMRQRNAAPEDVIEALPEVVAAEADTDIRCSICMCDVEVGETLRTLPCSHKYHKKCIGDWLTYNGSCPVDKKRICPFQRPV